MLRLALRLGLGAARDRWGVTLLVAGALSIASAMLLITFSIVPAMQARADRTAWLTPALNVTALDREASKAATLTNVGSDYFESKRVTVVSVAAIGAGAPSPPGVPAIPQAGAVYVSPGLAELIQSEPLLQGRYGVVRGLIGPAGLGGPDALLAVRGVDPASARLSGTPVLSFATQGVILQFSGILQVLVWLGGLAMLAPVALFASTIIRLQTANRQRRHAQLRLVGATGRQLRYFAAAESLLLSALALSAGLVSFILSRPLLAGIDLGDGARFVFDLDPGAFGIATVVIGVALASFLAYQLSLGSLLKDPLSVSRRVRQYRVSALSPLPLAVAPPVLAVGLYSNRSADLLGSQSRATLASFLCVLVAVMVAGPWLAQAAGRVLARSSAPAALLAGRRLTDDPKGTFRSVAGVSLAILLFVLFAAIAPAAFDSVRDTQATGQAAGTAQGSMADGTEAQTLALLADVRSVPGIIHAALVFRAQYNVQNGSGEAWIGDCREIVAAALLKGVPCNGSPVIAAADSTNIIDSGSPVNIELFSFQTKAVVGRGDPSADAGIDKIDLLVTDPARMPAMTGDDLPDLIVSPQAVGAPLSMLRPNLMLMRYSSQQALEEARTLVFQAVPNSTVGTLQTSFDGFSLGLRRARAAVTAAAIAVFIVTGIGLLSTTTIGLLQRRRPLALLRVVGVQVATIRASVVLEVLAPLVLTSLGAAAAGWLVGAAAVSSGGGATSRLWWGTAFPIVTGLVVAFAITMSVLPSIRRLTSSEETRLDY